MSELRTDAQLVTAYLAGDRSALAGIYDRFSPGLYDTAAAMLRDRHEAADAMQDVFLIACERLGQLREPERLKPWLYAILRNEVYRRSRKRGRALPTDFTALTGGAEMAAPIAPDAEGEALSAAELAELVRSAACGLDERDQLVLELSVRQGLQGADLAAALGVSAEQSYTLVHRMRERVDRSLGALVVARAGRKDCPDLADILRGWDGEFTVLIRKRVARHVENCETCERTKKKAAPLALIASGTAFAAPPDLRGKILELAGRPGAAPRHAYSFDSDGGFPRLVRHFRWPALLLGAALAVVIGVGGGAIIAASSDTGAAPAPSTTALPTSTVPTIDTSTVTTPVTTPVTVTTVTPSSTVAPPPTGELLLSGTVVDLGATRTSRSLDLFNPGGTPVTWAVYGTHLPFALSGLGGTLAPGQHLAFIVSLDRTGMPEGDLLRAITLTGDDGSSRTVTLKGSVEHPPIVQFIAAPSGHECWTAPGPKVEVLFSDESGIAPPIMLRWSGAGTGELEMKQDSGRHAYNSILVDYSNRGVITFSVTVTDTRGNSTVVTGSFINCIFT